MADERLRDYLKLVIADLRQANQHVRELRKKAGSRSRSWRWDAGSRAGWKPRKICGG